MRTTRLFRLLDAELVDAEDDLRDLEATLKARCDAREITNYVYRENNALLEQELRGIERIRRALHSFEPDAYADIELFSEDVLSLVRDHVEHHGVPGAVESIVARRLHRLTQFVREEDPASAR